MDKRAVVKITRRPGGARPWMCAIRCFGRDETHWQTIPRMAEDALGDGYKGYFNAVWIKAEKRWLVGTRVKDRAW